MIECPECNNKEKFREVNINAVCGSEFEQDSNGKFKRMTELEINANCDCETKFECAKCGFDLTDKHSEFLDNY